ncbi:MAG: hypothetical protein IPM35_34795 [Myxococcales bacterium]|nr:hypothetical protein [Myxococcales bacterium]
MRRLSAILLLAGTALGAAGACSVEKAGGLSASGDGGGGSDAGQSVTSSCFPPSKACPDEAGGLTCVSSNDPQSGCKASTSCAPCVLPHASAKCEEVKGCIVDHCDTDWSDCNGDPTDGCETSLGADPMNCGACGTDCAVTKAPGAVCIDGACADNPCSPPTNGNCDKDPSNGCEIDLLADPKNCSFCGNVCNLPHASSACEANPSGYPIARCVVQKCDDGWADCDGNPANGCENSASTDPSSCGGCGKKCNSTNGVAGCVAGKCDLICNPGFGNCDNNIDNGCETDLNAHVSNCGSCGNACPSANGTPTCVAGKCATGGCSTGYADCDGNPANGCETGTTTDPSHCGTCTTVCPGTPNGFPTCAGGSCGVGCSPGFSTCGAGTTCFDTTVDPQHCGAGCKACPPPTAGNGSPACAGGNCTITCAQGLSPCGTACVDLKADSANCGVCGKVCSAASGGTSTCVNGACDVTCPPNVAECNNQCVDVFNDSSNCGQCGKKCGTNQSCSGGSCVCHWLFPKNCGSYCAGCCNHNDCGGGKKCYLGACW